MHADKKKTIRKLKTVGGQIDGLIVHLSELSERKRAKQ